MKKVLVAVALVMGLGSSVAFAQEVENSTAVETQAQAPQDEFTKIDAKKLPCMQLYAGNFLAGGSDGKFGKPYENRDGVALEPQFLPNSMNIEKKPRVILRKGEEYEAVTTYRFETE